MTNEDLTYCSLLKDHFTNLNLLYFHKIISVSSQNKLKFVPEDVLDIMPILGQLMACCNNKNPIT